MDVTNYRNIATAWNHRRPWWRKWRVFNRTNKITMLFAAFVLMRFAAL
ncbi:hypothetical protein ABH09_11955 [Treponema sp. OMZ 803]|nr:hypothetical protein [Treponema sp. OMZ 803]UTC53006.1 hypothetical protein ABH09_11955 [Treponema sp. OMZ 803]